MPALISSSCSPLSGLRNLRQQRQHIKLHYFIRLVFYAIASDPSLLTQPTSAYIIRLFAEVMEQGRSHNMSAVVWGLEDWAASIAAVESEDEESQKLERMLETVVRLMLLWTKAKLEGHPSGKPLVIRRGILTRFFLPVDSQTLHDSSLHGHHEDASLVVSHPSLSPSHRHMLLKRMISPSSLSLDDPTALKAHAIALANHIEPALALLPDGEDLNSPSLPLPLPIRDALLEHLIDSNRPHRAALLLFQSFERPALPAANYEIRLPYIVPPPTTLSERLIRCLLGRRKAPLIPFAITLLSLIPESERTLAIHNDLIKHINILYTYDHHPFKPSVWSPRETKRQDPTYHPDIREKADVQTSRVQEMLDNHPTLSPDVETIEAHLHAPPRYPDLAPTPATSSTLEYPFVLRPEVVSFLSNGRAETLDRLKRLVDEHRDAFRVETWELVIRAMVAEGMDAGVAFDWMLDDGRIEPRNETWHVALEGGRGLLNQTRGEDWLRRLNGRLIELASTESSFRINRYVLILLQCRRVVLELLLLRPTGKLTHLRPVLVSFSLQQANDPAHHSTSHLLERTRPNR
jgi:hypothetical protein